MANEEQLRQVLISVFEHLKEHRNAISSLLAEVASLRDSLVEIGPKYEDILNRYRAQNAEEAGPLVHEALEKYDEIIRQLKDDDFVA